MHARREANRRPNAGIAKRARISVRRLASAVALIALTGIAHVAAAETVQYQGSAIDPGSGRVLYRETHLVQSDGVKMSRRIVLYQCANGTLFARKQVDYSKSQIAPVFEMIDARDGYHEGVRRAAGKIIAFVKPGESLPERSAQIASSGVLVADVGFDAFATGHWAALSGGQTLALDFVVPARGKAYAFKVGKLADASVEGVPALTYRLHLSGVLALFAPAIDVSYASASRRLLRFTGVTNIRSDSGQQLNARIDFPASAPKPAASTALDDAMKLPLKRCKVEV